MGCAVFVGRQTCGVERVWWMQCSAGAVLSLAFAMLTLAGQVLVSALVVFAWAWLAGTLCEQATSAHVAEGRFMAPWKWGFLLTVASAVVAPAIVYIVTLFLM